MSKVFSRKAQFLQVVRIVTLTGIREGIGEGISVLISKNLLRRGAQKGLTKMPCNAGEGAFSFCFTQTPGGYQSEHKRGRESALLISSERGRQRTRYPPKRTAVRKRPLRKHRNGGRCPPYLTFPTSPIALATPFVLKNRVAFLTGLQI